MKRLLQASFGWVWVLLFLVAVNYLSAVLHVRLDLTAERRFTISEPTRTLLENLDERVTIDVLLEGEMPAGFRKLAGSTEDLLADFREIAPNNISFRFERPGGDLPDTARYGIYDSLQQLGINPTNVKAQTKKGEGQEETLLFPGAVIRSGDRVAGVDFLQGQAAGGLDALNNADALLEYKLANAIRKVTRDTLPLVGYLSGNGQPLDYTVYDLIEKTLRPNYNFSILPIDSVAVIPSVFSAICIVKPMIRFSEEQKLKIDQYVMRGGRVIWMLDNLYANLDSLQRSEGQFIAFDLGLNLEDQLFRYGVRVNKDLVQDLQNDGIPSVIGNVGDRPQVQLLPWPYFPLLSNYTDHPVARNLDYVVAQFPHSIDTVNAPGIRKTVLLATSNTARSLQTPARVEWASIRREEDLQDFNRSNIPVAVLLEGRFQSLFANRISAAAADTLARVYGSPFRTACAAENRMIVIADGDLALNAISQQDGPLMMGMNSYTRQQYANREFLLNALEYLTDDSGILEARGKDYTLRLLDEKKVDAEKNVWQWLNIIVPMALVLMLIAGYQSWRRRRYGKAHGLS